MEVLTKSTEPVQNEENSLPTTEIATSSIEASSSEDVTEKLGQTDIDANSVSSLPAPAKKETVNRNVYIMMDVNHRKVEASDVIEYEWPVKSGDRWFLQEQIGELLDIKSFSRKFPDLTRRKVNHEEREHLEVYFGIHRLLNETQLRDMNAMRSTEIHDLMISEYPETYQEYKKVIGQREREEALAKAREMEAIKNDAVKLAELRKKALSSAAEFNKDLQSARKNERKHFWDIQTNIIQSKLSNWKKLSKEMTKVHPYPVALIPGQYQNYFKRFTKEELFRLPVGTVLDSSHLFPVYRDPSPPPLSIAEQDLIKVEREEARAKEEAARLAQTAGIKMEEKLDYKRCETCEQTDGDLLCCATCKIVYHPECIEMPERMAAIVKTYQWSCVDCRLCSICNKPDKEDEIVFCDRCDRGFHTYCVGLKQPPKGTWVCATFCDGEVKKKGRPAGKRQSAPQIEQIEEEMEE